MSGGQDERTDGLMDGRCRIMGIWIRFVPSSIVTHGKSFVDTSRSY